MDKLLLLTGFLDILKISGSGIRLQGSGRPLVALP